MQKQLLRSLILLHSLIVLPYSLFADCTGYDLDIKYVTVTGVSKNNVNFNFEISNVGTETILTNKLILQKYLSTDAEFQTGDEPAGGSVLTYTGETEIGPGNTIANQYSASHSNILDTHPYLIVQFNYSGTDCNFTKQMVVCLKPDAQLLGITITNVSANNVEYEFEIKNIGGDTLFFNKMGLQNYWSQDNVYDLGDVAAGGTSLSFATKSYLLPNESYTDTYSANGDHSSASYVVVRMSYNGKEECSTQNNDLFGTIPVATGTIGSGANSQTASIFWSTENKSFTVNNWKGSSFSTSLEYRLYNAHGVVQSSGNVATGEVATLTANPGIYMLVITDGKESKSVKVVY